MRVITRGLRRTGAVVAAVGLVGLAAAAPWAGAAEGFTTERIAGADRYDTAGRIAVDAYQTRGTRRAILATGGDFPDALSANYLAGVYDAPILLTQPGAVPANTAAALAALGVKEVYLLGGTDAIGANVEAQLRATTSTAAERGTLTVTRIAGAGRYDTSRLVALAGAAPATPTAGATPTAASLREPLGLLDGRRTAIVASGMVPSDAMAVGPLAFDQSFPLVLTAPTALSPQAASTLRDLQVQQVILVGGTAAVSAAVEAQIVAQGATVVRIGGADRTATSVAIADFAIDRLGFDDGHTHVASATTFVDALTGGPHAGLEVSHILLTDPANLSAPVTEFLRRRAPTLVDALIFGGTAAVSANVEAQVRTAAT